MNLVWTSLARDQYKELENNPSSTRILKDVRNELAKMPLNLCHPSLNTHEYQGLVGAYGEKVFQQNTSSAYRILWHYGPDRTAITIVAIIPHPK